MFLLWLSEGSGASAICPCFTNHHLAGIWQHVKSSQDSCFSTICWITKEITRLLGCLPDGKQVCLWVSDSYFLSMLSHAVGAEAEEWKGKKEKRVEKWMIVYDHANAFEVSWNVNFPKSTLNYFLPSHMVTGFFLNATFFIFVQINRCEVSSVLLSRHALLRGS